MKNNKNIPESTSSEHLNESNPEFHPINSDNMIPLDDLSWSSGGTLEESENSVLWSKKNQQIQKNSTVTVFDVAAYILKKMGCMSTMKLQKLVYYCQAWSLVWDEEPLFMEDIEAWANGPVIRELFNYHRGHYNISEVKIGNPDTMTIVQKATIDAVLEYYGNKSAQWLIDLSHLEDPWKNARSEMREMERGNKVIPPDSIAQYYSSL